MSLTVLPPPPRLVVVVVVPVLCCLLFVVLNGMTAEKNAEPVNNVCFPSVVNVGYAPEGYNLCR